jgi:hypothetical protein
VPSKTPNGTIVTKLTSLEPATMTAQSTVDNEKRCDPDVQLWNWFGKFEHAPHRAQKA